MALTKYEQGSLRELSSIAFPLMLTSFSVMFMLFIDRLMLANYSSAALNAAVNASTLGWSFLIGSSILTGIAEVFVAQYNGAGEKFKLGKPVWQMIWLSLITSILYIPLTLWGGDLLYGPSSLEALYFRWMMVFGPSFPLYAALSAFFIGQGKTFLVTILAVVGNLVNIVLDYILIFGIDGYVQPMGLKGAAIATFVGTLFQIVVLGFVFLSKNNRSVFGTSAYKLDLKLFSQCIKIGLPGSVFVALELMAWAVFYWQMTMVGDAYITIAGICQSIIILFYFFNEGMTKAIMTVSGNLIGAQKPHLISKALTSGVRLTVSFFAGLMIFFLIYPHWLISQFLPEGSVVTQEFYNSLLNCMIIMILYLFGEGLRALLWGVLTAAGDTIFLFISGTLSIWVLLVIPVHFLIVEGGGSNEMASFVCLFYSIGACLVYYWRYVSGKWRSIALLHN